MHLLKAAHKYIEAGLAPIPIWPDRRKNPHLTNTLEYNERQPTKAEWARWARRWAKANIGLITGYWRNLIALDFDDHDAYSVWDGPKGQTWTVATARGYHVWFELIEDPGKSRTYTNGRHEVLLRAKGGYCISPPSVHHTGARYRTVHKIPPLRVDSILSILPSWTEKQTAQSPQQKIRPRPLAQGLKIEDLIPIPDRARANSRGAYQVYCPFHEDRKPSAWLNPTEQRFGCNACWPGLWWDVVNVYAKMENISNGEAYKFITQRQALGNGNTAKETYQ